MRKNLTLIIFLFLCCIYLTDARIITVSNNVAIPALYSNLQQALDDASPGDTIYVHNSTISYGNIIIRKRVVLLGEGFKTFLQSITLSSVEGSQSNNCSGSVIKEIGRASCRERV